MTTTTLRYDNLLSDLISFGVKPEEIKRAQESFVKATEKPLQAPLYSFWEVLDPVTGDSTSLKQLMPFNVALALAYKKAGVEIEPDKLRMPKKPIWVTLKGESEYLRHIPDFNSGYRPEPSHANKIIDLVMRKNGTGDGRGFYGYGEAGTGKTSMALWFASVIGQPVVQFNCSSTTETEDLFLRQISINGVWKTVDSALLTACKRGYWCIVDELDLAPASLPPSLNDLIEGHSYSVAGLKEAVKANDQFRLLAFGNTGLNCSERGNYNGRNVIDESTLSRFVIDKFENLSENKIKAMILGSYPEVGEFAEMTAKFFSCVENDFAANNISSVVSPRNILDFVEIFKANENEMEQPLVYAASIKLPIINNDDSARESVLTQLTIHFRTLCPESDIEKLWKDRNKFKCDGSSSDDEDIFASLNL